MWKSVRAEIERHLFAFVRIQLAFLKVCDLVNVQ